MSSRTNGQIFGEEVSLYNIGENRSTQDNKDMNQPGKKEKVSGGEYGDLVYLLFDLCYSMVTGIDQNKKND